MVTGVETVGIILAILPLVVNQLDAYVQGLVTIKTFRTKRYRRELESYLTRLGTHQAIFLNTLEQLLEDIVDDDEVRDLIDNPTGTPWQDAVFQETLRKRLGRDHDIYIKTMTMLSGLLQDLSNKLGLETNTIEKVRAANFILPIKVDPFPTICWYDLVQVWRNMRICSLTHSTEEMGRCEHHRKRSQEVQRRIFKIYLRRATQ
jgi:hypothetical protein